MRHWQASGLKPHIVRGFKVLRDPLFAGKPEDVVGLYMSPPEYALVLCCDHKSQVQALNPHAARLVDEEGGRTDDDARLQAPSTTTLFAALNIFDGQKSLANASRATRILNG